MNGWRKDHRIHLLHALDFKLENVQPTKVSMFPSLDQYVKFPYEKMSPLIKAHPWIEHWFNIYSLPGTPGVPNIKIRHDLLLTPWGRRELYGIRKFSLCQSLADHIVFWQVTLQVQVSSVSSIKWGQLSICLDPGYQRDDIENS